MATGETLLIFNALSNQPPATNYATFDTRNNVPVLDFDASTSEAAVFGATMPRNYAAGGVTISIIWMASTATSGAVVWDTAFERGNTDQDSDSFATAIVSSAATANGTSGIPVTTTIAHTNAQLDGLLAGEYFRLRLQRLPANAGDTMAGDAELIVLEIRET